MNDSQFFDQPRAAIKKRKNHRFPWKIVTIIAVVLVVAALGTLVVLQQLRINDSGIANQEAARQTQDQVSQIMIVPTEDALVSDVENADQIKSQPFFANAQNGDKVLVFASAAKIVIYRPSTHQIVNAGPIVDDQVSTEENTN